MTRRKVTLAFIANDSKRKITFLKRRKGLIKKIHELSTLCGIEACAIIYGQNDPQPEIWPSPDGVHAAVSRFRGLTETEQSKKMQDQESFLREKIRKGQEQLNKLRNENRRKQLTQLMFQCINAGQVVDNVSLNDLNGLAWTIDQNLKQIQMRMEEMRAAPVGERHMEEMRAAPVIERRMGAAPVVERRMEDMRAGSVVNAVPVVENHAENEIGPVVERRVEDMRAAPVVNAVPVVENHAENVIGRELGMENNVGAMQTQQFPFDFMNNYNNFGDLLPFENGNINAPNYFWP